MKSTKIVCPNCDKEINGNESSSLGGLFTCPSCNATSIIAIPTIEIGDVLGGFELISKLGQGGMGEVWLANQIGMNRKTAIKILHPYHAQDVEYIQRFLKESKLTAQLQHENIVTTYAAGEENNFYYLALSYIEGKSLDDLIEQEKILPEKRALKIVRDIAEALKYAWEHFKIIHRDIKPDNIMLEQNDNAILMDMGISKTVNENTMLTMTGVVIGTPYYISPEQASADRSLDFRSDMYSLGATLYHTTTGYLPFNTKNPMSLLAMHKTQEVESPKLRNPQLSDSCSNLILKTMEKEPDNRYQTWDEFISDIDAILNDEKLNITIESVKAKKTLFKNIFIK